MSEIILQTMAIKITNRGGGTMRRIDRKEQTAKEKVDTGTDYVVFNCPHPKCGKRNKQSMYEMANYKPANEDVIPFKCKICRRTVEVARPRQQATLIMDPAQFTREMADRRKALAGRQPVR